jgi:GT2 family glycosyltransferase
VTPSVSFIMACRDAGDFLAEALASVAAQRRRDWELLLVDDGSTDPRTLEILAQPREGVRLLRQAAAGVTHARNRAIAEARGRYLSFFDADDLLEPEFLERTVEVLDRDSSCTFVTGWARLFGDESWDWKPERVDLPWLLHDCSIPPATLVSRQSVVAAGGFDPVMERGHEDWDLWISLLGGGARGAIVPEVLMSYRRHARSRSSAADHGQTRLDLFAARLRKHRSLFFAHLPEVVWLKQTALAGRLCLLGAAAEDDPTAGVVRAAAGETASGRARNRAAREADGEHLVFAPASAGFRARTAEIFAGQPDVGLVVAAHPLERPWLTHSPWAIRRRVWERLGGSDEALLVCDDVDLQLRALQQEVGMRIVEAPAACRPFADWPSIEEQRAAVLAVCRKHARAIEPRWESLLLSLERSLVVPWTS